MARNKPLRKITWDIARRYERMFGGITHAYCPPVGQERYYSACLKNKHGETIAKIKKTPLHILKERVFHTESG